jgi:thioredoxin-like negative regulator of GroEL
VGERDLGGDMWVVISYVRARVVQTVFELDVHHDTELLDVEGRCGPIDPDLVADRASLVRGKALAGLRVEDEGPDPVAVFGSLARVDVDANEPLARRYEIRGIPSVKAFRNGQVVSEFVGAQSPASVARFLDELAGPSKADQLVAELRASGEDPELVAAIECGDDDRALALVVEAAEQGDGVRRERMRQLAVALFGELGNEHPLTERYRRRLAAVLY